MRKLGWFVTVTVLFLSFGIHAQNKSSGIISFSELLARHSDSLRDGVNADTNWLVRFSDNPEFSKTHIDLRGWIQLDTLKSDHISQHPLYRGFAWLRLKIVFDTLPQAPYAIAFNHRGASTVFMNGIKKKDYGTPALHEDEETREFPYYDPVFMSPKKGDTLSIAVRYSNSIYQQTYSRFGQRYSGVEMSIWPASRYYDLTIGGLKGNYTIGMILVVFFITLCFVHLLLYLFYRKAISNLYYSMFCLMFAFIIHALFISNYITDATTIEWESMIAAILFPLFFVNFLNTIHTIFSVKYDKFFILIAAIAFISIVLLFIENEYFSIAILILIGLSLIRSLVILYKANKDGKRGAKLIGAGFGFLALFLIIFISVIILNQGLNLTGNSAAAIIVSLLLLLSILAIPISMSIYLAWDFSQTNRTLSKKLVEVEELSARTIEQEKEKQHILERQNEVLEEQVQERTKEIKEQKKVIEEKNKDITDSINYAQRIQHSILPTQAEIHEIFKDNFVLFKPRDIVSGDFYQFKKNGNSRYAILADCTGHGVPGALMSMIGSNLLHQLIIERGIKAPDKILSELHKEVRSTLRQGSGIQSHDGMDAAIVMTEGKKLFVASANRPVYIVNKGELTELKPDKRSIGGSSVGDDVTFTLNEIDIDAGMMVYLFSDGYADQFGGDQGKKFKVKNLSELLLSISAKPLDTQKEILNSTFDNWKKQLEQVDDVSLIGLKF